MPIKSYLIYPHAGQRESLQKALIDLAECELIPAKNEDVIVLVTDTADRDADKALLEKINKIPGLQHMTLVSGFNSPNLRQGSTEHE